MIAYIRQCFPTAAVLVMSVSDRSGEVGLGIRPNGFGIPTWLGSNDRPRKTAGAAFWSARTTPCESLGGMAQFVANGWAGKDYTHINFAGGRRVAWALFDAINARCRNQHPSASTPVAHDNVIDTRKISHLEMMLRQAARPRTAKTLTPGHDPDGGKYRGKAGFDAHVRRIAAVDLQQRAVPFPLRRIPLLLRIHPPGSDGPHRLCHPLFALLLLQVERHLLPAARLRFGERLTGSPMPSTKYGRNGRNTGSWD